jgi:cystathionine gamma-synthase
LKYILDNSDESSVTIANASSMSPPQLPDSTDAVHAGVPSARPDHGVAPAVVQTATYAFADTADLERFQRGSDPDLERQEYGRYGNPTVREVEHRIAALDGAEDALLFASGMAAVTTAILALVKAGDHIVLFRDVYRQTRTFVTSILERFGVEHSLVEPASIDGLRAALRPRTRVAITESPTNPYLRCIDLAAFAAACRAARVKSMVDATFATPFNARPLAHGVDLVLHSATKYLSGHNDVLGGSVAGGASLISLIRDLRGVLGGVADAHAAALIGRGIKTLALRVERQNATALSVARALSAHPAVSIVHYPWLSSHPDHGVAREQMRGGGGVVSFEVRGGRAAAGRVVDRCRLAILAPSLGGVETLIEQPAVMSFHELGDEELAAVGIAPGLIRLAVGIEETDAVVGDVLRALDTAPP